MSWPQWQQPPAPVPAVIPAAAGAAPLLNPAPPVIPPTYTPEQWAQLQQQNWQQWAQWQQQYQQWHQQYGAEYQKSINALAQQQPTGLPNMAVPPPLPAAEIKPPPPNEPPPPPPPGPSGPSTQSVSYNTGPPPNFSAPPPKGNWQQNQGQKRRYDSGPSNSGSLAGSSSNDFSNNKKFQGRYDSQTQFDNSQPRTDNSNQSKQNRFNNNLGKFDSPNQTTVRSQNNQQNAPKRDNESNNPEELSEAEKKFDKQFAEWEAQFQKWKEQNAEHPDKEQYKEYEKKWEKWRAQLLERREQMKKRRLEGRKTQSVPSTSKASPGIQQPQSALKKPLLPTPAEQFSKPPPHMNDEPLSFKGEANEFLKPVTSSGIPGLDLVKEEIPKKVDDDVVIVENNAAPEEDNKGPDLEAISKGIKSILGDQKLMNMLSMVSSQQQTFKTSDNLINTVSKIKEVNDHSNLSQDDHQSNHSFDHQRDFINNMDDQTRLSFTQNDYLESGSFKNEKTTTSGRFSGFENRFEGREGRFGRPDNRFGRPENRFGGFDERSGGPERFSGPEEFSERGQAFGGAFDTAVPGSNYNKQYLDDRYGSDRFGPSDRFQGPNDRFQGPNDRFQGPNERFQGSNDRFQGPNDGFQGPNDRFRTPNDRFQGANERFLPRDDRFGSGNRFGGPEERYPNDNRYHDFDERSNKRFMGPDASRQIGPDNFGDNYPRDDKYQEPIDHEERNRYPPYDQDDRIQNDRKSLIEDNNENIPPPEDDLWKPSVVTDYDHKSLKPPEPEILVEPIHMFDYRHKPLSRIPLPQRPKWLVETVKNIREFDPPLVRPFENLRQRIYPTDRRDEWRTKEWRDREEWRRDREREEWRDRREREDYRREKDDYRRDLYESWRERDEKEWRDDYRKDERRDKDDYRQEEWRDKNTHRKEEWRDNDDKIDKRLDKKDPKDIIIQPQKLSPVAQVQKNVMMIDDLLCPPGRYSRPPRVVIILRGPPGSGKTFLAKLIKDKEMENGGSAPRILSLDDYFMVEHEKEVTEDGKKIKIKEMVYEYEAEMEENYRNSLIKSFKKTITDGYFSFIIVDNVNDKVKYFGEMWSFAKQNGFQVYVCQMELDTQLCTKRNIHGRSEADIEKCIAEWEPTPNHHPVLDASSLIQSDAIPEVEMEEVNSPENLSDPDEDDDDEEGKEDQVRSKWDNFDCSVDNLAKLDGVNKPLRASRTMEEYLQLDTDWTPTKPIKAGQKRVRWADLEEQKQQEKMRAIGFVVGQTDWDRMMDPSKGSSALTQTKYIERTGRF